MVSDTLSVITKLKAKDCTSDDAKIGGSTVGANRRGHT